MSVNRRKGKDNVDCIQNARYDSQRGLFEDISRFTGITGKITLKQLIQSWNDKCHVSFVCGS